MVKKTILLLLMIFISFNLFSKDIKELNKEKEGLINYTYIIPGIEQIKRGYYLKGTIFFTSFIATITGAIIENKKGNDSYNTYINSVNIDEIIKSRIDTENHFEKRNYYLLGGFSIWIINLADLKFFSKNRGIKGEIKKNYISFGFYYIF